MLKLATLGQKICIIGCSSSGKSTLADRLSYKLNIPVYHLDRLAHYPNTKWIRKSDNELIAAQAAILDKDKWIIDGNYSACMAERIQASSAIIWLDLNIFTSAYRYLIRSLKNNPLRIGGLPGAEREFRFGMVKHILLNYPKSCHKYQQLIKQAGKKTIYIYSMKELKQYYNYWGL